MLYFLSYLVIHRDYRSCSFWSFDVSLKIHQYELSKNFRLTICVIKPYTFLCPLFTFFCFKENSKVNWKNVLLRTSGGSLFLGDGYLLTQVLTLKSLMFKEECTSGLLIHKGFFEPFYECILISFTATAALITLTMKRRRKTKLLLILSSSL